MLFQEQNFQTHGDYYCNILTDNAAVIEIISAATSRDKKMILYHRGTRCIFKWTAAVGVEGWWGEDGLLIEKKLSEKQGTYKKHKWDDYTFTVEKQERTKITSFILSNTSSMWLMWDYLFLDSIKKSYTVTIEKW